MDEAAQLLGGEVLYALRKFLVLSGFVSAEMGSIAEAAVRPPREAKTLKPGGLRSGRWGLRRKGG